MQIITNTLANGLVITAKSADGRYTWTCGAEDYIQDTATDRAIYQMSYLRNGEFGSDPLPPDVEVDARAFWAALSPLVAEGKEQARIAHTMAEDERIKAEMPTSRTMQVMGEDW